MTNPIHFWQINLTESCSSTLPFENGRQIRTIAVSPDGRLLLSIDDEGRALVVNRRRRALLHHFSFKGPVRAAKWSPDGRYVAAGGEDDLIAVYGLQGESQARCWEAA